MKKKCLALARAPLAASKKVKRLQVTKAKRKNLIQHARAAGLFAQGKGVTNTGNGMAKTERPLHKIIRRKGL